MLKTLIYVFSALAEIYIANKFFSWLGPKRVSKNVYLFSFVVLCLVQTGNALALGDTSYMMLVTIAVLFLTSLLYRIRWIFRLLSSTVLCILMALAEMAVVLITTLGGNIDVPTIQDNVYLLPYASSLPNFSHIFLLTF